MAYGLEQEWHVSGSKEQARQAGFLGEEHQSYWYCAFSREQAHPLKSWAHVTIV